MKRIFLCMIFFLAIVACTVSNVKDTGNGTTTETVDVVIKEDQAKTVFQTIKDFIIFWRDEENK